MAFMRDTEYGVRRRWDAHDIIQLTLCVTVVVVVPIRIVSDPAPVIAPILGLVLTNPLLDEVWPAAVCETVN